MLDCINNWMFPYLFLNRTIMHRYYQNEVGFNLIYHILITIVIIKENLMHKTNAELKIEILRNKQSAVTSLRVAKYCFCFFLSVTYLLVYLVVQTIYL